MILTIQEQVERMHVWLSFYALLGTSGLRNNPIMQITQRQSAQSRREKLKAVASHSKQGSELIYTAPGWLNMSATRVWAGVWKRHSTPCHRTLWSRGARG
jgi:hypothetical protein